MAYCLDDGKIDQESEFETELYNSLLKQLKEMKNDISNETLALIWLYLKTFGMSAEPLLIEGGLWNFDRKDFRSAILTLTWDGEATNDVATHVLKKVIVNRLKSHNQCLKQWLKDIYNDVLKDFCSNCQIHNCPNCKPKDILNVPSHESIHIKIDCDETNGLHPSGNYTFHKHYSYQSMENGVLEYFPTYIREFTTVPGYPSSATFFLRRKKGYWCIYFTRAISAEIEIFKISTNGKLQW